MSKEPDNDDEDDDHENDEPNTPGEDTHVRGGDAHVHPILPINFLYFRCIPFFLTACKAMCKSFSSIAIL